MAVERGPCFDAPSMADPVWSRNSCGLLMVETQESTGPVVSKNLNGS